MSLSKHVEALLFSDKSSTVSDIESIIYTELFVVNQVREVIETPETTVFWITMSGDGDSTADEIIQEFISSLIESDIYVEIVQYEDDNFVTKFTDNSGNISVI